jgi:hypothetical protein
LAPRWTPHCTLPTLTTTGCVVSHACHSRLWDTISRPIQAHWRPARPAPMGTRAVSPPPRALGLAPRRRALAAVRALPTQAARLARRATCALGAPLRRCPARAPTPAQRWAFRTRASQARPCGQCPPRYSCLWLPPSTRPAVFLGHPLRIAVRAPSTLQRTGGTLCGRCRSPRSPPCGFRAPPWRATSTAPLSQQGLTALFTSLQTHRAPPCTSLTI